MRWPGPLVGAAGWLFVAGIFIFSGSLYVLSIGGIRWLGAITPIGGLCMIAGWAAAGRGGAARFLIRPRRTAVAGLIARGPHPAAVARISGSGIAAWPTQAQGTISASTDGRR